VKQVVQPNTFWAAGGNSNPILGSRTLSGTWNNLSGSHHYEVWVDQTTGRLEGGVNATSQGLPAGPKAIPRRRRKAADKEPLHCSTSSKNASSGISNPDG